MRKPIALCSLVLLVGIATTLSAALLGVSPGYPNFSFRNATTTQTYDPGTQTFAANSILNSLAFFLGDSQPVSPAGSDPLPTVAISIQVDNSGNLTGTPTSRDVVIRGTITDPSTSQTYTGDLLTGSIKGFGFQLGSGGTSTFDFDFAVTGGTMASYFSGQHIGIILNSEGSTFTNSFAVAFNGHTKGNIGPIPGLVGGGQGGCTGTIGDFVWNDLNQNGIQDAGEPGINGVQLTLLQGSQVVQTVTTANGPANQMGYYQFTNICPGTYTVQVTGGVPANFVPTLQGQGTPDVDSNNPSGTSVTLSTSNPSDQTIDFGYYSNCNGQIGDFVWNDANNNGIQDAGELGIPNVVLNLYDSTGTNVLATTTTDANGVYSFGGVCSGTYSVQVMSGIPAGFTPTTSNAGADRTVDSNGSPALVTLATNQSVDNTIDFGYIPPAQGSIGDFVWYDQNQNGIQDAGEPGINGVTVQLTDSLGNTQTQITGPGPFGLGGYYQFTGLAAGTYTVKVVASSVPANYTGVTISSAPGSTVANDSNQQPSTVVLATNNSSDQTIDFGYVSACTGSIGDFVWSDTNGNGIQDTGEPGINGVTLNLLNPVNNAVLATTTTANGGAYHFTGLCPGSYKVQVVTPVDYVPTVANATGSTTANDSNTNPSVVTLAEDNSTDNTIDFGFVPVPPVKVVCPASSGVVGVPYSSSVSASGGTSPYTDTITSGALPTGLLFNTPTVGAITGTPTAAGAFNFTVNVTDSTPGAPLTATASCTINIVQSYLIVNKVTAPTANDPTVFSVTASASSGSISTSAHSLSTAAPVKYAVTPGTFSVTEAAIAGWNNTGNTCVNVSVAAGQTVTCTLTNTKVSAATGYTTYTQGGWGTTPHGNNPGSLLQKDFATVYPGGSVSIGGTKKLTFTSSTAIHNFLPQGGTPGVLAASATNPTSSAAGVFAGQVLALQLNVDFSNKGITKTGLANLHAVSGMLAGQTVGQILALANSVIGGGALPSGMTVSNLNDIVNSINNNFDSGAANNGYLY